MSDQRIITKYDYLRYFTRISKFWFHSNLEIDAYIQGQLHEQPVEDDELDEALDPEFEMYDFDELNKSDGKKDQKTAQMIEGNLIEERFVEFIKNEYPALKLIDLRPFFNTNELVQKTKEAIASDNCLIMQATFFSEKRQAVCKTDFLIVEDGMITILEVKGTTTVKRKHFLDVYYQYQIATDAGYAIADVMMGLIRYEKLKRGQISFIVTSSCQLSADTSKAAQERYADYYKGDETQAGQARKLGEMSGTRFALMDGILGKAEFQGNARSQKTWDNFWTAWNEQYAFDKVLAELREHETEPVLEGPLHENDLDFPQLLNSQFYEYAPEVRAILAKSDERYGYSGMIVQLRWRNIQKSAGASVNSLIDENENALVVSMVQTNTDQINRLATLKRLAELKESKVFFDFESINPAVRAADDTYPFQQVVTQCSVIRTDDMQKRNNLIIDPQAITNEWWSQVIASIYKGTNWSYVVYNKSFECSRLKEMAKILKDHEETRKVQEINDNVFDLADIFDVRKQMTALAPLKGYYSIKKVLPLARSNIKSPLSSDYNELQVQKGTDAMELTMKRHFDQMDEQDWKKAEKLLCAYCENDVLAMIDVLYYAKHLVA